MSDKKYKLDEYLKLEHAPQHEQDGFATEAEYEAYWARTLKEWAQQYDDSFKTITQQWEDAVAYVENAPTRNFDAFIPDIQIAQSRIPYALCALLEVVAMLFTNYPQPMFVSPAKEQDQYAMALQQLTQITLKQNGFNALMFEIGIDLLYANLAVLKTYIDYDSKGPFGEDGRITIQKVDPLKVKFDPKAARLRWEDMGYVMVTDYFDLGTAQKMFKGGAGKLKACYQNDTDDGKDNLHGQNLITPVANPLEDKPASQRQKVKIVECWFKDDRLKFVADTESVINREFITDDDGNQAANPDYDPEKPEIYTRPMLDDDGYVIGSWEPAYPHGRCVVLGNDKRVVLDFENPYWHDKAPFVFFKGRPSRKLVTTGDLTNIVTVDRKINDVLGRIHIMAQSETERPMIAEVNTFKTPRAWFRMSGMAQAVIVKNPGREFGRLPPTEIPQFVFAYLSHLMEEMNKVMAVAGIVRGDLAEGAQLSAETVASVQGMATTVLKMKAELIAEGIKDLGYQIGWLQRENSIENIKVPIKKPDGTAIEVEWNEKDAADDYIVEIDSGSGLIGSQHANPAQVLPMFVNGLVDRLKALQLLKFHDAEDINNRMEEDRLKKIESASAGTAMGTSIKNFERENAGQQSGRKMKL